MTKKPNKPPKSAVAVPYVLKMTDAQAERVRILCQKERHFVEALGVATVEAKRAERAEKKTAAKVDAAFLAFEAANAESENAINEVARALNLDPEKHRFSLNLKAGELGVLS